MIIERVMILSMLYVTCVGHLYVQGYHWSGGQYVLRDIQDIFTVGAQTVLALKVERKDCELSSALFATYWNSQEWKPIKAKRRGDDKIRDKSSSSLCAHDWSEGLCAHGLSEATF